MGGWMIKPWMFIPQASGPPSGTFYPAVNADDFEWYSGNFYPTIDWLGFGAHDQSYHAGVRFKNVTIPKGATITAAYMIFTAYDSRGNDPHLHIYANAADNPEDPINQAQAGGLALTTAFSEWDPAAWTGGSVYNSPSLITVVKEIVDRAGWSSGNAMLLIIKNQTAVQNDHVRNGCQIGYSGGTKKTGLHVEWTA
jgi:type IV pilus assembly protein PilY1